MGKIVNISQIEIFRISIQSHSKQFKINTIKTDEILYNEHKKFRPVLQIKKFFITNFVQLIDISIFSNIFNTLKIINFRFSIDLKKIYIFMYNSSKVSWKALLVLTDDVTSCSNQSYILLYISVRVRTSEWNMKMRKLKKKS